MNILEITEKKENKKKLTQNEINFVVENYTNGKISDKDMSQFLFAIYNNGMTFKETYYLTKAMQNSGETIDLSFIKGVTVDKHSTGGISDSTTMIVAPIVALSGLKMLKASGRALGHTGGTADKLECFKGYRTALTNEEIEKNISKNGACLVSQSLSLAPADKKIYALRDKIRAVDNIPLIASSIMSKKLACGNEIIVLDVKVGNGAFMKDVKNAKLLAKTMVQIGKLDGKKCVCVLTDMNQPLGNGVGDLLECYDVIDVLNGKNNRLAELSKFLSAKIIELGKNVDFNTAYSNVNNYLSNGKAKNKFKEMILSSGGSTELFESKLDNNYFTVKSLSAGYVNQFLLEKIGNLEKEMKQNAEGIGFYIPVKIGDKININDEIAKVYSNDKYAEKYVQKLRECIIIKDVKIKEPKLIIGVIE